MVDLLIESSTLVNCDLWPVSTVTEGDASSMSSRCPLNARDGLNRLGKAALQCTVAVQSMHGIGSLRIS